MLIELDVSEPVISEILPGMTHKQPKIIVTTLSALTSIIHNYGCKIIEPKPILNALPKPFAHADKNVRAEAQNLAVEMYRWLKEASKASYWAELKPVQQQDLEKLFESVKQEPSPKQERLTRAQQEAAAAASEEPGDAGMDVDQNQEEEIDAFDLVEAVDVVAKAPKDLFERLSSTKWKDRKEALDDLFAVANVTKIKDGPYEEIVRALAKSMKDANVAVVTVAANTVEVLAKGLRGAFAKHRSTIMPPIMERLKEKKPSVADALGKALDAVFLSTGMSDCLEDITEFLKHKNPQVKQETLKFLIRCLRTTRDVPSKPEIKLISEAATKLLTESVQVTRDGGAEVLGTLMKIMGERAMNPYVEGLDDIRKTKIKEYFASAEVKAKDRPKPIVGPPKSTVVPVSSGPKKTVKKPVVKKTTPSPVAPASPPEELSSPMKPKGIPSRLGSIPKSGAAPAGSGLKLQRKLPTPGAAGPPPQLSSPQRKVSAPTEDNPPLLVGPKLGLSTRGLTGRPLGRPITQTAPPTESGSSQAATTMSVIERAELEELRLEKDRLSKMADELKSERSKLTSEVNELQNQNAHLIEDHTRDVLSIKAKETQLVRARSDAETAEQTVQKQQREIERLKRELSRALRASAASPPTTLSDVGSGMATGNEVYHDTMSNGSGSHASHARTVYHTRFDNSRPLSYISASPSEEKENTEQASSSPVPSSRKKYGSPVSSSYSSGRASPKVPSTSRVGIGTTQNSTAGEARAGSITSSGSGENWKRAAEVTSQLKARIEQMKV